MLKREFEIKYERIIFFFPTNNIGGAQLLFIRAAKVLKNIGCDIYVMDYENGYMHKNSQNFGVNCLIYSKDYDISEKDLVVFPLTYIDFYLRIFRANNFDCLFWCLHPKNSLVALMELKFGRLNTIFSPILSRYKQEISSRIEFISNSNSIVSLDKENRGSISAIYGFDLPAIYLNNFYSFSEPIKENKNSMDYDLWVGRIDVDSKYHVIDYLLSEYVKQIRSKPFWVVGAGEGLERIKKKYSDNEDIYFLGEIYYEDLLPIIENSRCVFAMGTSCLEAVRVKKPSFVLDIFYSEVDFDYRFETLNCQAWPSLGTVGGRDRENGMTYDQIDALDYQRCISIGEECRKYAEINFGEGKFLNDFKHVLNNKKNIKKLGLQNDSFLYRFSSLIFYKWFIKQGIVNKLFNWL
jgi:glycosyltransferase involved in cell wall biosynthesis